MKYILSEFVKHCRKRVPVLSFVREFSVSPARQFRVLFFGSDNVALKSLQQVNRLYKNDHLVKHLQIVTANKSANPSLIEKYAHSENLNIISWPVNGLESDQFDIGLVVSFGHLIPEHIISKFPLGMVNVHTSLLPRWRGAAPVIHTLLHGDPVTGVTLMSIKPHQFDIGEILSQESIVVSEDVTLPELTTQLAELGSQMLVKCIKTLPHCLALAKPQDEEGVTYARKVDKSISIVKWNEVSAQQVYNLHRAVYGLYQLSTRFQEKELRLLGAFLCKEKCEIPSDLPPGAVDYCKHLNAVKVVCNDKKYVCFKRLRIIGKREISALDFYNGYLKKTPRKDSIFY